MNLIRSVALTAALVAGASTAATAQSADTVVATVNGTEITLGHMAVLYDRLPQQYRQLPPEQLYTGILEQLIQQIAVADRKDSLSEQGELVLENERRAVMASEVISEVTETAVTEDAIQAAYEAEYADAAGGVEYNANHILVETEQQAQDIIAEIEGGADFGELAKTRSTGPSAPNGGSLGWFAEGTMVDAFETAVVALEPGEISAPLETQFGWHVIKLNETRQTEAPALDEVRQQLVEQVRQQAVEDVVDAAMSEATVERADTEISPSALTDESLFNQ